MESNEESKEGQIQLLVEYGSQFGQLQVNILEINNLLLPAVKRLGISHIYVKSHLLCEKTKDLLKTKSSLVGFFLADATKDLKRKTEEVKLTLGHYPDEEDHNVKSRKSKLRVALQKQRERFRLRRNSDKVKTMVNNAGNDHGRATLSFERPLYYPSVSLYQLQTQFLHLTICGRNVTTTKSIPLATTCVPLMVAIKQHHPAWYQLSYNPDLTSMSPDSKIVKNSWEKMEGGAYTGRSLAWNKSERKDSNQDSWLLKRKDYSRHGQMNHHDNKQVVHRHASNINSKKSLHKSSNNPIRRPSDFYEERRQHNFKKHDSGVDLHHNTRERQDSIEELHFNSEDEIAEHDTDSFNQQHYSDNLRNSKKKWTSEFVICTSKPETKRNSRDLDLSSLSLHNASRKFNEGIRGF